MPASPERPTASPPSGTVVFLFTDIEGSTRRWEEDATAADALVGRHLALLREAIEAHRGVLFKTVGDAVQAAFPTASGALAGALDGQRALLAEARSPGGMPGVRMALHAGDAAPDARGDYLAAPLNRLSRLLAAGHGGQVLLTQAVQLLTRGALPEGASLRDLGEHRLRDLREPERVFQLLHPDLPAAFPPLLSVDARPNNLPQPPTPFLGRAREVEAVVELLASPEVAPRLLTLTGPGGTGKTRLALAAATALLAAGAYPDGVFFVPLAPVADPALVPAAVAEALALRDDGRPLPETLADALRARALLLVLDNVEHLPEAAPFVAGLLAACPRLVVLATSRAPLRLRGERELPVPPLPLPRRKPPPSPAQLSHYDAVRLFVERARAVRPDFGVTEENAPAVAEICRRLDGLPLAIELAAARVRLLPPQAMLARLDRALPLLTGGPRDLPDRQRTLRATIDWSHDLLSPDEQALFRRLAVFAGGWTLEAAEAVADPDGGLDAFAGFETLSEQSLVTQAETPDGEIRFAMLETIREFARERLEAAGEGAETRQRLGAAMLALAEAAAPALAGPDAGAWLARLDADHDNLRAALAWVSDRNHDPETFLRLAVALWRFWDARGAYGEGRAWLERALAAALDAVAALRAEAAEGAGSIARMQGDAARATTLLEEALALREGLGDRPGTVRTLMLLGHVAHRRSDLATAEARFGEALVLAREDEDRAAAVANLGIVADERGEADLAESRYREGLTIFRALGDLRREAAVLDNLGIVARGRGDLAGAIALQEQALPLRRRIGDAWGIAATLGNLGVAVHRSGDLARARALYDEALALFEELGERRAVANTRSNLAAVARQAGDPTTAVAFARDALALARELDDPLAVASGLEEVAALAATREPGAAARLLAAAGAARERTGQPLPPDDRADRDQTAALLGAALDPTALAAATAAGAGLDPATAAAEALTLTEVLARAGTPGGVR